MSSADDRPPIHCSRSRVWNSSSCAIVYYLARYPEVQHKLQRELDEALGMEDEMVSTGEKYWFFAVTPATVTVSW